jgi:hypothetical protein
VEAAGRAWREGTGDAHTNNRWPEEMDERNHPHACHLVRSDVARRSGRGGCAALAGETDPDRRAGPIAHLALTLPKEANLDERRG